MRERITVSLFGALIALLAVGSVQAAEVDVGSWDHNYSGDTRGFHFTSPVDFNITGLRVPVEAGTAVQNIEIVRFNTPVPTFSTTSNDFTSLGRWTNVAGTGWIVCNIAIHTGDIIGILGARGTSSMSNPYGTSNTYATTIDGQAVTLYRLGMQYNLNTTAAHDLWTEASSYSLVEVQYYAGPYCGDGNIDTGEDCDDSGESATCDADCTLVSCGDGTTNTTAGEDCDDSGESATCDADCTLATCGDGTTNTTAGEDCDDSGESATCDADCTAMVCGDGTTNTTAGEACDDTNTVDCDGCHGDCSGVETGCGDGFICPPEECDDLNTATGDGCDENCDVEDGWDCTGEPSTCEEAGSDTDTDTDSDSDSDTDSDSDSDTSSLTSDGCNCQMAGTSRNGSILRAILSLMR